MLIAMGEINIPMGIYRTLDLGYEIFRISDYQNKRQ